MNYTLTSATILLILITDPVGNIPIFARALRQVSPERRTLLIVPLAIPALAGPSALATVMLLVSQAPQRKLEWIAALCITMAVCAVVLVLAERIQRVLGERVVVAVERLMGLILVAVSVEMMLRGFKAVAQQINSA